MTARHGRLCCDPFRFGAIIIATGISGPWRSATSKDVSNGNVCDQPPLQRKARETAMTRSMILLGAIALSSTLAGPASAQHVSSNPGACAQFYPGANCRNYVRGNPNAGYGWRRAYDSYGHRGHHRDYVGDRHYPVGQANLSSYYW